MKKLITLFASLLLVFAFVMPVCAESQDYWAYVYKAETIDQLGDHSKCTRITSGITFKVLAVDANTSETLTYYGGTTSLTNPVTTTNYNSATVCDDKVAFRCDPTDSTNDRYVDLIVVDTAGGYTAFIENFDKYTHTIIIDERPNVVHHGCIWFAFYATATERDTGIDFDDHTFIHDVWVEVVTVDSTETIDVGILSSGTNGDADGLRDGVSLATAGYIADTAVITDSGTIDYTPVSTYGALLVTAITGSAAIATNGGKSYIGHVVVSGNEASLTYTPSTSDTAYGYLHYFFTRMR